MDSVNFAKNLTFANEFWVFLLPCALMAIDFITGFINAWVKKRIKSYLMRSGLGKKCGEIMVLIVGLLFTLALGLPEYIVAGLSLYIVLMETISICENLHKLGVPIPKWIVRALGELEEKIQNGSPKDKKDGEEK